jgi:type I restriction enzyme, S subunit
MYFNKNGVRHSENLASSLAEPLEAQCLNKAFRGELVPQDPKDEPASALLDRIRTEKTK